MNNMFKAIFQYIANKFGFTLQPKMIVDTDFDNLDFSITGTISNRMTTLALMDSDVDVIGESERANKMQGIGDYIWNSRIKTASIVALGTGDCLLKPNVIDDRYSVDIIANDNFQITEQIGDEIYGALIKCDEIKQGTNVYERIEYHRLRTIEDVTYCYIYQMAYCNGNEIELTKVAAWAKFEPEIIISNCNKLLFGRIKCPTVNRYEPNSVDGVPITFGCGEAISKSKEAYRRFNKEFEDKETIVFASKYALTKNEQTGEVELPRGKKSLIAKIRGGEGANAVETYSPDIRDTALINGIDQNLRMIETLCGLSNNVLTKPTDTYTTATQIRASLNQTYAYITELRKRIENAVKDVLRAIDILMNVNQTTPQGEWDLTFSWSDKLMESSQETFNQYLQLNAIGGCDTAEVRAWTLNEDIDTARKRIEEIDEQDSLNIENELNG